jgi:hypothetical protein
MDIGVGAEVGEVSRMGVGSTNSRVGAMLGTGVGTIAGEVRLHAVSRLANNPMIITYLVYIYFSREVYIYGDGSLNTAGGCRYRRS